MKGLWRSTPLGELCTVCAGGTPSRSKPEYWSGDTPWVKISDMLQGTIIATEERITELGLHNSAAKLLPAGTLLLSIFATIGRTAVLGIDAATNQAIVGLRVRNSSQLSLDFLRRFLEAKTAQLESRARGVAQANINGAILKSLEVSLPPLAEQRRIAEVLDRADALRAKRRAALAQLDSLTQSLFLDLFGDPITNPKKLPIEPMGKLFSVKHGFAFQSEYFTNAGKFTLLTPGNFYEGGGYRDRGAKQKYYVGPMPTGYTLHKNDLLVAMTEQAPGLLGSPILIPESNMFLHNQRLGLVEAKPGADRLFLFHLFNTRAVRNQIQASSTGTKVKHTSPSKITAIKIPVPSISLQREFARRVAAVEKLKAAQRAALAELDALFASLQHRAFRGEL